MPKLKLVKGDERAREFLEGGATIVDFLTDPFRPCVVYSGGGSLLIAVNHGNHEPKFVSHFWDNNHSATAMAYAVEYMADESVVVSMQKSFIPKPRNARVFLAQNWACELLYRDDTSDIAREFIIAGYELNHDSTHKWLGLQEQAQSNIEKMAAELAEFYGE